LLLMDQARKGKIEQRENYVWGSVEEWKHQINL
jgi:hypothetical protein